MRCSWHQHPWEYTCLLSDPRALQRTLQCILCHFRIARWRFAELILLKSCFFSLHIFLALFFGSVRRGFGPRWALSLSSSCSPAVLSTGSVSAAHAGSLKDSRADVWAWCLGLLGAEWAVLCCGGCDRARTACLDLCCVLLPLLCVRVQGLFHIQEVF